MMKDICNIGGIEQGIGLYLTECTFFDFFFPKVG